MEKLVSALFFFGKISAGRNMEGANSSNLIFNIIQLLVKGYTVEFIMRLQVAGYPAKENYEKIPVSIETRFLTRCRTGANSISFALNNGGMKMSNAVKIKCFN